MAVTEALMQLFLKETVSVDRMRTTVKRFAGLDESGKEDPADQVSFGRILIFFTFILLCPFDEYCI
jgi:hypothetical protein